MSQTTTTIVIPESQLQMVVAKLFLSIFACALVSCAPYIDKQNSSVSKGEANSGQSPPRVCIENYVGWCFLRGDLNINERARNGSSHSKEWVLSAPWLESEIRFHEGSGCRGQLTDRIVKTGEGVVDFEGRKWDYVDLEIFDGCQISAMTPSSIYSDRRLLRSALGLIRFCFDVECRSSSRQNNLISTIN